MHNHPRVRADHPTSNPHPEHEATAMPDTTDSPDAVPALRHAPTSAVAAPPEATPRDPLAAEVAQLRRELAAAVELIEIENHPALQQRLSPEERRRRRQVTERLRAKQLREQEAEAEAEFAAKRLERRTDQQLLDDQAKDERWHRRALAARRRRGSAEARLARTYRLSTASSIALIVVAVLGLLWSGVNVQHNIAPDASWSDPLRWLSYGIEAMFSVPIIAIMVVATVAAEWGKKLERGKVIFFEVTLIGASVGLNAGPHLAAENWGKAAQFAAAPAMVGMVIWLNAWITSRYAVLIDEAEIGDGEQGGDKQMDLVSALAMVNTALDAGLLDPSALSVPGTVDPAPSTVTATAVRESLPALPGGADAAPPAPRVEVEDLAALASQIADQVPGMHARDASVVKRIERILTADQRGQTAQKIAADLGVRVEAVDGILAEAAKLRARGRSKPARTNRTVHHGVRKPASVRP